MKQGKTMKLKETKSSKKGIHRGPRTVEMCLVAERRAQVKAMTASGMTIPQIATELQTSIDIVGQDRSRIRLSEAGLKTWRKKRVEAVSS
jgi:DNA-binding NarL/FixJ family response regulator